MNAYICHVNIKSYHDETAFFISFRIPIIYRNQVVDSTYNDGCFQYNVEAENVRVLSPDGFLELGAEKRVLIKSSFK